jgi:hypothetical protein
MEPKHKAIEAAVARVQAAIAAGELTTAERWAQVVLGPDAEEPELERLRRLST